MSDAEGDSDGLEPPTEASTRVEPPTERQPHAEETEAIAAPSRDATPPPKRAAAAPPPTPPPPPFEPPPRPEAQPSRGRRKLVAISVAIVLGLIAGLVGVVAINGRDNSPSAQATTQASTALDPVETLGNHFDLLEQGRFVSAADNLTPALLDSLGGKVVWVSERIADLMIDAQLDATVIEQSDTTATVRVNSLRTQSLSSGCTDFSGTYGMVRSGDVWLIDSADLVSTPC